MKLQYKVSEENYIEMLEAQIKRQNKSFKTVLITLLCTVGQMGMLIYFIARGAITGKHIYILGAMSLVITALNLLYRFTVRRRAKVSLEKLKLRDNIKPDFWKEHELRLDQDKLTIRYGSLRSTYATQEINGCSELDSAFLLYCSGVVADIIPYSALENKDEFIDALENAYNSKLKENAEQNREDIPETYKYSFDYAYTIDTYVAQQREAYRRMYTTKQILNLHTLIRAFVSVYAIVYMFQNPKAWVIALCLAVFVIFNMQHIVTFTPLCNITIKSGIKALQEQHPDPSTTAYITSEEVLIRNDKYSLNIPMEDIKAMRPVNGGVALYLPKSAILTIPRPTESDNGDFDKFIKFMNYKAN